MKFLTWFRVSVFLLAFAWTAFGQADNQGSVGYGILLDNSFSMIPAAETVKFFGEEFVRQVPADSEISLFAFKSSGFIAYFDLVQSWGKDKEKFINKIDGLGPKGGKTELRTAIDRAGKKFLSKDEHFAERILLIVTDGDDKVSSISVEDLIANLKSEKVKVFVVGLVNNLPVDRKDKKGQITDARKNATDFLTRLADSTGGAAIFPKDGENITHIVTTLLNQK